VPKNSRANCSGPGPIVGNRSWLTNSRARTIDHLQKQLQHRGITTTTETKPLPVHVNTEWADGDELEIEIKREAV